MTIFNKSKYTKWYYDIINARKSNKSKIDGEKHHIIPRSLDGTDAASNIVKLSYREHYLCHLLLTKMCKIPDHTKRMCWAFHRLTFADRTKFTSYQYEICRKIHIKNLIENHPSKNIDWVKAVSKRVHADWKDNEKRRIQTAIRMKKTIADNKEFFAKHQKKASKAANAAYRKKYANRYEYKGKYYHSFEHLKQQTGVTVNLYKTYYLNGIDPEPRIGANGPTIKRKENR